MTHEYKYDEHTWFYVEFKETDESYDDEFGKVKGVGVEVESLRVVTYMGHMPYDVTSSLDASELGYFKDWAIDKYLSERGAA